MGVMPCVNRLYNDLADGQVLLQLYDVIYPGIVNWKRVVREFNKRRIIMEMIGSSVVHTYYSIDFIMLEVTGQSNDFKKANDILR